MILLAGPLCDNLHCVTHWLVNGLDVLYFIGIGVTDCIAWQRFGLTYGRPACQARTKASAGHWHRLFIRGGNPDIVTEVDISGF